MRTRKTIRDAIHIACYPDMDRQYSYDICSLLEKINNEKHIDCVVATCLPKQSVFGTLLFKRNHPDARCIAYCLDTIRSNKHKYLPLWIHNRMMDNYEREIFSTFDKVIVMKYGVDEYPSEMYKVYQDKVAILGLPSLEILDLNINGKPGKRCVYIGTTYSDIRNPMFAMKVFDLVHTRDSDVVFQIYGSTNMKAEIEQWEREHADCFSYHGHIDHKEVFKLYEDADYIVSLSNTIKGIVAGKTFEIFGTLKPIVHFSDIKNDSSLEFFAQYPNVCIIDYGMSVEEAASKIAMFFERGYSLCEKEEVSRIYSYATPKAASTVICDTCDIYE